MIIYCYKYVVHHITNVIYYNLIHFKLLKDVYIYIFLFKNQLNILML